MFKKFLIVLTVLALATPASAQWHRGYHHGGNWWVPGAIIGGAIVGSALIYNGVRYNDAVAYCSARYKSYNPADGTFLGVDGYRHPCP